jgi:hypothetical protein
MSKSLLLSSRRKLVLLTCTILLAIQHVVMGQADLRYQDRGDRFEGIRQPLVSGYDIELLSAIANYKESTTAMPAKLKLQFFLDRQVQAYVVVRELEVSYYYWMDRVHGPTWRTGFSNYFEWPTAEVLQKLRGIKSMYELGVIARLNDEVARRDESIAPVILYNAVAPRVIDGYLFTFKTNGSSRMSCAIYREGKEKPLYSQNFQRVWGGEPFTLQWTSYDAVDGWYKVVIKGSFRENNDPIDKVVRFYHKRTVS